MIKDVSLLLRTLISAILRTASIFPRISFSTLKNAFITLFQLFTLDHWYEILNDMVKAVNPVVAKIYVLLWICIGAFVFRNIFAGIMGRLVQSC